MPDCLDIALIFARADDASDPYAFTWAPQGYIRRLPKDEFRTSSMAWTGNVQEDLVALVRSPVSTAALTRIGTTMRTFLRGTGWDNDEAKILAAVAEKRQVRLTFRFAAAELYALPWEALAVGPGGLLLGNLPGVSVRYAWPGIVAEPRVNAADRLLFAWSEAGGAVPYAAHEAALVANVAAFRPAEDVVANASYAGLAKALRAAQAAGRPYTAVHLLAHGGLIAGTQTVGLVLENRTVDGVTLKGLLHDYAGALRLVTLCACRCSDPGAMDTQLGSVAQEIHRAGVASVLASRLPLSVAGSTLLTTSFYSDLAWSEPGAVNAAIGRLRRDLRESDTPSDGVSIQLYSGEEEAIAAAPASPPAGALPPAGATPAARRALVDLFLSLFSADELRRFLRYGPEGDSLGRGLPGGDSSALAIADAATELLIQRGLADGGLFDRLVEERPRRKADIDPVRGLFKK